MPKNWNRRFKHNRDKMKTGDVFAFALAGDAARNLRDEPVQVVAGRAVRLEDLWPTEAEIETLLAGGDPNEDDGENPDLQGEQDEGDLGTGIQRGEGDEDPKLQLHHAGTTAGRSGDGDCTNSNKTGNRIRWDQAFFSKT